MEYPSPAGTHGKKKSLVAAEQDRPDIAADRRIWRRLQAQPWLTADRLVFLDETWASTNMARRYARSPRGQRAVGRVPHGHWKTTTVIAGLRTTGIVAPFVIGQPVNGAIFRTYVERVLSADLKPGDIVIMDNLSAHKVAGIRTILAQHGALLLYLPPYSPDLNPIEQAFAKLKTLLRGTAARTVDALWDAIGRLVDCFQPGECENYITNSGYLRSM